ncbi:MAG: hypothetical protein Q7N87_03700 [Candidatus Uhrbacteria bacterium]|nr:hypothetical protein [Candidatus Uhrbacteria bacterium]
MTKNKTIGLILVLSPFALIIVATLLYTFGVRMGGESIIALRLIRLIAGISSFLAFPAFFVALPIGIYFLVKKSAENKI